MALQALLDDGDEVLDPGAGLPAVDRGGRRLAGGTPVHYLCDESAGWQPDLDDIAVEDHRPHQGDRHHQPEQPDRRRLPADDRSRASSSSPASTT